MDTPQIVGKVMSTGRKDTTGEDVGARPELVADVGGTVKQGGVKEVRGIRGIKGKAVKFYEGEP